MWLCVVAGLLGGIDAAWLLATGVSLLLGLWGAWRNAGLPRIALIGFGGSATAMFALSGEWGAAAAALRNASVLIVFLACLYLLRALVEGAPQLPRVQAGFGEQPFVRRRGAVQLLAWVFALPLAVGATSVVVALVRSEADPARRLDLAGWAMRGVFLTVLYSPFTIAMAVVTSVLSGVDLVALIATGFVFSALLLVSAHAAGQCRLPRGVAPDFWPAAAAVIAPVLGLVAVNTSIILLSPFSPAQAGSLVIPAFVALAALYLGRARAEGMLRSTREGLTRYDGEVAVFLSALLFAGAVAEAPAVAALLREPLQGLGPSVLIVATGAGIVLCTFVGLHMVVSTSVLLGLFAPAMPDAVHVTALGLAALTGWGLGAMCGIGSVSFLTCARLFDVPARGLALGRNLRFILVTLALSGGVTLILL